MDLFSKLTTNLFAPASCESRNNVSNVFNPNMSYPNITATSFKGCSVQPIIIMGAGRLGESLINFPNFSNCGLEVVGLFDIDPNKIGNQIGQVVVEPVNTMPNKVDQFQVQRAIIAVPPDGAQEAANALVRAGIRVILNYAPTNIQVPMDVLCERIDPATQFLKLLRCPSDPAQSTAGFLFRGLFNGLPKSQMKPKFALTQVALLVTSAPEVSTTKKSLKKNMEQTQLLQKKYSSSINHEPAAQNWTMGHIISNVIGIETLNRVSFQDKPTDENRIMKPSLNQYNDNSTDDLMLTVEVEPELNQLEGQLVVRSPCGSADWSDDERVSPELILFAKTDDSSSVSTCSAPDMYQCTNVALNSPIIGQNRSGMFKLDATRQEPLNDLHTNNASACLPNVLSKSPENRERKTAMIQPMSECNREFMNGNSHIDTKQPAFFLRQSSTCSLPDMTQREHTLESPIARRASPDIGFHYMEEMKSEQFVADSSHHHEIELEQKMKESSSTVVRKQHSPIPKTNKLTPPIGNSNSKTAPSAQPSFFCFLLSERERERLRAELEEDNIATKDDMEIESHTVSSSESESVAKFLRNSKLSRRPNVRWSSVAGLELAKRALSETLELPVLQPQHFPSSSSLPWSSMLLYGPPGCGKTLLAKAVATELFESYTFYHVLAADLVSQRSDSECLIHNLFEAVRSSQPAVLFLDNVDVLCRRGEKDVKSKSELIRQLDKLKSNPTCGVFVLAATNLPWELDVTVLRHFEKRVLVPLPEPKARKRILEVHIEAAFHTVCTTTAPILRDQHYHQLVRKTDGYSASDIALVVKSALFQPIRRSSAAISENSVEMPIPSHATIEDFLNSCKEVRPTLTPEIVALYEKFTTKFGEADQQVKDRILRRKAEDMQYLHLYS